jgi:hypothetical protein
MHPMVLQVDAAQVEACFCPFRDSANLDAKIRALFTPNVPSARKLFWTHSMELLGNVGLVKSRFGPFGDGVGVSAR